jgi:hypothetical protein
MILTIKGVWDGKNNKKRRSPLKTLFILKKACRTVLFLIFAAKYEQQS